MRTQETAYKLLTQWYATPAKLRRWFPHTLDSCWICGKETGTLQHIWWECPVLSTFWNKVTEIIKQITETRLTLNAACCLLHISNFPLKRCKQSLTKHLLNTTKSLIPLLWKCTRHPTIQDWLAKVTEICHMEDTLVQTSDRAERYQNTWSLWFAFKVLNSFEILMNQ